MKNQKNFTLWFTGLSGSGKTTLAENICKKLKAMNFQVLHLDGDKARKESIRKLGFNKSGRDQNIKAAIKTAKKYQENGFIIVASFISPYKHHRDWGREALHRYVEIFVDAPIEICEQRDCKGLYKKARAGEIKLFTGVSDDYQKPENPDIHLKTEKKEPEECAEEVMDFLKKNNFLTKNDQH